jgi:predicted AAA+ superfamily ATPase
MKDLLLERKGYLQQIAAWIDKPVIKVIIGQRRVGKSKFMFQIMKHIKKTNGKANIIYINTEEEEFQNISDYKALQKTVNAKLSKKARNYLFIDEIQDIKKFERALRNYSAKNECDIYCTGSNSNLMSGELASYLSGRYVEFKIHPLSFNEFCLFHNLPKNNDALLKYFRFGGLPFLRNLPLEEELANEYLHSVYNTILLKDIAERYDIRNLPLLKSLSRYIASNTGSVFSSLSISKYLKSIGLHVSPKSILDYADYLKNALLVNQIERYDLKGKKIFSSGGKIYFEDLGLRNIIVQGFKINDIEKILENAVHAHLAIQGYEIFTGDLNSQEIDFIAEKNSKKIYVQVAYKLSSQETIDREFGNLLLIKDNFPKIVVTMDELAGNDYQGIKHIHILDFLQS